MMFGEAEALKIADLVLLEHTGEHLTDLETIVLQGSWQKKTYEAIAQEANFNPDYIRGTIGQELWRKLSEALQEKVEKRNFRTALERQWEARQGETRRSLSVMGLLGTAEGWEIERPELETLLYHSLAQPGGLVRLKAPWQMGKTTLMTKGLRDRAQQGDRTVRLSLRLAEVADFASLERFLWWFCASITEILGLENQIEHHWQRKLGNNKVKCMTYFEKYLLAPDSPLVLALDDVDRIFPYTQIAGEFLGILRTFHEQAKTRPIWQKLRLMIVHTEVYEQLEINQSPFNVGTPIQISEFSFEDVQTLARYYHLEQEEQAIEQLMKLVGGHPYLIQHAFFTVSQGQTTWTELWQDSATENSIYSQHLRRYRQYLQQLPTPLQDLFQRVLDASEPVQFQGLTDTDQAYRLCRLGLLKKEGTGFQLTYPLYYHYFRNL